MASAHTSINICDVGVDLLMTEPETGTVKVVFWTWDEVQEFVRRHGMDATAMAKAEVGAFIEGGTSSTKEDRG